MGVELTMGVAVELVLGGLQWWADGDGADASLTDPDRDGGAILRGAVVGELTAGQSARLAGLSSWCRAFPALDRLGAALMAAAIRGESSGLAELVAAARELVELTDAGERRRAMLAVLRVAERAGDEWDAPSLAECLAGAERDAPPAGPVDPVEHLDALLGAIEADATRAPWTGPADGPYPVDALRAALQAVARAADLAGVAAFGGHRPIRLPSVLERVAVADRRAELWDAADRWRRDAAADGRPGPSPLVADLRALMLQVERAPDAADGRAAAWGWAGRVCWDVASIARALRNRVGDATADGPVWGVLADAVALARRGDDGLTIGIPASASVGVVV